MSTTTPCPRSTNRPTASAADRGERVIDWLENRGLRYVRTFHLDWPEPIEGAEKGDVEYALLRDEWEDLS